MSKSSIKVFTDLNHKLMKLDAQKHELGLLTKDYYFTRKPKKLSFVDDMKLIMSMGPSSLKEEMYKYFGYNLETVSASGFVESRVKIKDAAFKELMNEMNKAYPCKKTYKGYRLLAVDGSDITIPIDKNDHETVKSNGDKKQSAMYHLNALYDIINHRYLDAIIQGVRNENEKRAMIDLAKNYKGDKAIFIADRGYEVYNVFENIRHTGDFFLIRVRNIESNHSICRRFKSLPNKKEFDEEVDIIFTNKQTSKIKSQPEKYISIMSNQNFDFLDKDNHFYDAKYRFIRIKIDGKDEEYETLITNLSKDEFSSDDIKELYKLRWNIEISYKHLKYSVNLNALHCKRRDFIKQEIWARLVMFNISMIIIDEASKLKINKANRKHEYQINISRAIHLICGSITKRKGGVPPDLIELIAKEILPIRPGRSSIRNVKSQSFVSFNYRFC